MAAVQKSIEDNKKIRDIYSEIIKNDPKMQEMESKLRDKELKLSSRKSKLLYQSEEILNDFKKLLSILEDFEKFEMCLEKNCQPKEIISKFKEIHSNIINAQIEMINIQITPEFEKF